MVVISSSYTVFLSECLPECASPRMGLFLAGGKCAVVCVLAGVGIWRRAPEKTGCLLSWKENIVQHNRIFVGEGDGKLVPVALRGIYIWLHVRSINIQLSQFQTVSLSLHSFWETAAFILFGNLASPPSLTSICLWNVRLKRRRLVQRTGTRFNWTSSKSEITHWMILVSHSDLFI